MVKGISLDEWKTKRININMSYNLHEMNRRWAKFNLANPIVDEVFYDTFYDKDLDLYFVNSLFEYLKIPKVKELTLDNIKLGQESQGKKSPLLDLLCKTEDQQLFNVEIQIVDYPWIEKRMSYYISRLYTHQFVEGFTYKEAKPSYSIWIFPERKKNGNDPIQHFIHYDPKNNQALYDNIESLNIIILDIAKIQDIPDHASLIQWRDFFMNPELREKNMALNPRIKKAYDRLEAFSQDPENFKRFERRGYELQDILLMEEEIVKERLRLQIERQRAENESKRADEEQKRAQEAEKQVEKFKKLLEQSGIKIIDT